MKVILCVVALVLMASGCVSDNSQRKVTMAEVLQEAAPQVTSHPCGVALVWDKKIYENDCLLSSKSITPLTLRSKRVVTCLHTIRKM